MDSNTPLQRAKQPRTALAGPYGHPFHPILVTIPIGTWVASLIFDLMGLGAADPTPFALGAQVLIAIGIIGALLAAIFGFIDFTGIASGTPAKRTALIHMSLNLGVVVLFAVNYFVRAASDHDEVNITGLVLTIIGLAALGVSGWLGGKLAYHYGVRVADEGTQAEGFRPAAGEGSRQR
ncbi:DUF2231 domain-containing protein [Agromyces ramosus]|uniref:Membrane protein n=1 Tax=Agromyces ramosus TaxID=33879 RepID=A0ABU0R8T7_9MICO|nr:DUF2231 domain-containing protein [Agromyces ramosus]MDQ0893621.1 putative membrane protein [Agromyces ramosus]